jgi:CSLREA domain-containing protein
LKPLALTVLALAFVLCASPSAAAGGSPFTVNDTTDAVDAHPGDGVCASASGKCTLRAAVQEANALPGADTIILKSATYKFTIPGDDDTAAAGDLDVLDDVQIRGAGSGATVINANQLDRAFDIYHGLFIGQHIDITGVTIRNGLADYGAGILINPQAIPGTVTLTDVVISESHATVAGGGIANHEILVISDSAITGNRAASGDIGGGIFNAGDLTISDSTISGNSADGVGGGLYNTGPAAISGATFSGNSAGSEGGGVANAGGVVTMTNVTFSGNTAGSAGGGIYNGFAGSQMTLLNATLAGDSAPAAQEISHDNTGPFHLKNTIIAGTTAGKNCAGTLSSDGHNLASDATCGLTHGGDKKNMDPVLGPLADNGGPTQTRALLAGSPAIDVGSGDCPPPATDQRGTVRPQGAGCDIGAFELVIAARIWGDNRCDGNVDATDALADLLNVAGVPPISQAEPCTDIGDSVDVQGFSPHMWGDVDCSGSTDSADALRIERFVAGLPVAPISGCPTIGSAVQLNG